MELVNAILEVEMWDGEVVEVRKPPIMRTEEIRSTFQKLVDMNSEALKSLTFRQAYVQVKKFRRYVNKIFQLAGLDPSGLNEEAMVKLLFPYYDTTEDGEEIYYNQGRLMSFILGERFDGESKGIKKDDVDELANLLGTLWAITQDYNEAIVLLNNLSYKDLDKVLHARAEAMMPAEEKGKRNQFEASKKLMENLKSGKAKLTPESQAKADAVELSEEEIMKFF